jgi:hypothetical protein
MGFVIQVLYERAFLLDSFIPDWQPLRCRIDVRAVTILLHHNIWQVENHYSLHEKDGTNAEMAATIVKSVHAKIERRQWFYSVKPVYLRG